MAATMVRRSAGLAAGLMLLSVFGIALVAGYVVPRWNVNPDIAVVICFGLLVLAALAVLPSDQPWVVGAALRRLAARLLLCASGLLNRTRPLHPFRWAAVFLFTVGSLIELIFA